MNNIKSISIALLISTIIITFLAVSCRTTAPYKEGIMQKELQGSFDYLIPKPVQVHSTNSFFKLERNSKIFINPLNEETMLSGKYLQKRIQETTGFELEFSGINEDTLNRNIYLILERPKTEIRDEGYELVIGDSEVVIKASEPEGLFRGTQTLSQLLYSIKLNKASLSNYVLLPTATINDYPRFTWRGVMLDVARHFFSVDDVKKVIDRIAHYKFNRLHLHLTDDQGWRIEIKSWPNLALYGGSTQVGGGDGGYYTQEDYSEIVNYAKEHFILVVPEIDMPGHTNAALASYPELNCNGIAPSLYTGIKVGFSSLCLSKDSTYIFVKDVIGEISKITPGEYIHIGGDEAFATDSIEYIHFIEEVQKIVQSHGKKMIGWEEISQGNLKSETIVQHWRKPKFAMKGVEQGAKLIMSPSTKVYLDMKYTPSTVIGLNWAAYIEVEDAYNWDPVDQIDGLMENDVLGVEAPLWSETILNLSDIEYMLFPRLPGVGEIGWSAKESKNWDEYKTRLAKQSTYWRAVGLNFYRSPQVKWD